jgi:hypothetical protein
MHCKRVPASSDSTIVPKIMWYTAGIDCSFTFCTSSTSWIRSVIIHMSTYWDANCDSEHTLLSITAAARHGVGLRPGRPAPAKPQIEPLPTKDDGKIASSNILHSVVGTPLMNTPSAAHHASHRTRAAAYRSARRIGSRRHRMCKMRSHPSPAGASAHNKNILC